MFLHAKKIHGWRNVTVTQGLFPGVFKKMRTFLALSLYERARIISDKPDKLTMDTTSIQFNWTTVSIQSFHAPTSVGHVVLETFADQFTLTSVEINSILYFDTRRAPDQFSRPHVRRVVGKLCQLNRQVTFLYGVWSR
eukprot:TRINITY_DN17457_c0_g1_i1.p1 TRINITY_DN17457_c0_g1~~TRINITY_DN17457_c0_g1_i1.p1  ORF type:complete len:138 (-),score=7.71 TRINITY_DN17457_c0_g1_i1:226-639(-)